MTDGPMSETVARALMRLAGAVDVGTHSGAEHIRVATADVHVLLTYLHIISGEELHSADGLGLRRPVADETIARIEEPAPAPTPNELRREFDHYLVVAQRGESPPTTETRLPPNVLYALFALAAAAEQHRSIDGLVAAAKSAFADAVSDG